MLVSLEVWGQSSEVLCTMLLGGKLGGQVLNAIAPGRLIHLVDQKTGEKFLVDTGAAISVMPFSSPSPPTGPALRGPNGLAIPCWGKQSVTLLFTGRQFRWNFLLASVDFPIIGIDFLRHYKLLVDPAAGRLRPASGGQDLITVAACISSTSSRPPADPTRLIAGAALPDNMPAPHYSEMSPPTPPATDRPSADSTGAGFVADTRLNTLPKVLSA